MDQGDSASDTRALETRPCGVDAARGEAAPERARAESLAQARAALAAAVLMDSRGQAACLRVLEPLVHGGRLRRTALLLERPVPAWVEGHVLALHAQAGCHRRACNAEPADPYRLAEALGELPWSGEWLIVVLDRVPGGASADHVRGLAARWVLARNAFVEAHVGLVRHVVNRYGWSAGVLREDLIQEGQLALCRAVERFDPDRGARFSSYAVPVIRHAIAHYVGRMGSGPGTPGLARSTIVGVSPAPSMPTNGRGRPRRPAPLSLDAPVDDEESLAERLTDPESPLPDLAAACALDHERLHEALRGLPAEIEEIVSLHWGLNGSAGRPVHALARELGRTPAEVRTLLQGALGFLRNRVTGAAERRGTARVPGAPRLLVPWACAPPNGRQRHVAGAPGSAAAFRNGDAGRAVAPIPQVGAPHRQSRGTEAQPPGMRRPS
jgi:RNA polymerase sigma factor (sigma-70 family)